VAARSKIAELESMYGDLHRVIPARVNELGSAKAAAEYFGVAHSTIVVWLKENGYVLKKLYVQFSEMETCES